MIFTHIHAASLSTQGGGGGGGGGGDAGGGGFKAAGPMKAFIMRKDSKPRPYIPQNHHTQVPHISADCWERGMRVS